MEPTQTEILMLQRNNADARRLPHHVKYIIDSQERVVYNREPQHTGGAIYIETTGHTRAIYTESLPTTRVWGSDSIHTWLDAVHQGLRAKE